MPLNTFHSDLICSRHAAAARERLESTRRTDVRHSTADTHTRAAITNQSFFLDSSQGHCADRQAISCPTIQSLTIMQMGRGAVASSGGASLFSVCLTSLESPLTHQKEETSPTLCTFHHTWRCDGLITPLTTHNHRVVRIPCDTTAWPAWRDAHAAVSDIDVDIDIIADLLGRNGEAGVFRFGLACGVVVSGAQACCPEQAVSCEGGR